jgi:hypothetical protein
MIIHDFSPKLLQAETRNGLIKIILVRSSFVVRRSSLIVNRSWILR